MATLNVCPPDEESGSQQTLAVGDVESFTKSTEDGDSGDHVMKFVVEDDFDTEFVRAVTARCPQHTFELRAAGVVTEVDPYDTSVVVQETLNQMTGEEREVLQVALLTKPNRVSYR